MESEVGPVQLWVICREKGMSAAQHIFYVTGLAREELLAATAWFGIIRYALPRFPGVCVHQIMLSRDFQGSAFTKSVFVHQICFRTGVPRS